MPHTRAVASPYTSLCCQTNSARLHWGIVTSGQGDLVTRDSSPASTRPRGRALPLYREGRAVDRRRSRNLQLVPRRHRPCNSPSRRGASRLAILASRTHSGTVSS